MSRIVRIEAVCWILGLALVATYGAVRAWADGERAAAVASIATHARAMPLAGEPDQSLWSRGRRAAYAAARDARGAPPLGVLRLPAHGLAVPVYGGATELNLTRGVALVDARGSLTAGGNIGIAGHRDGFFRVLKDVRLGDELALETPEGVRRYRVSGLGVVTPTDTWVLAPSQDESVTLVTCYPFYFVGPAPERYIVRAVPAGDRARGRPRPASEQQTAKETS